MEHGAATLAETARQVPDIHGLDHGRLAPRRRPFGGGNSWRELLRPRVLLGPDEVLVEIIAPLPDCVDLCLLRTPVEAVDFFEAGGHAGFWA